jgi:SNF family Na+-dependent transporter
MPTLFRLLFVVAIVVGLVWGAMFALATFVKPAWRQITETIPASRLNQ